MQSRPPLPEWKRTAYLSTIPEDSGESRNDSRETAMSEQSRGSLPVFSPPQKNPEHTGKFSDCCPDLEMSTSNEKQKSVSGFSPKKMAGRTTIFRLPSPNSDEQDASEGTTDVLENP